MSIEVIPVPAFRDNYIWLILNTENSLAVAVDPGDAAPLLSTLKEYHANLAAILITHHHWDHSGGITELAQHYSIPVFGSAHEKTNGVTHLIQNNDHAIISAASLDFQVLDIPGHTHGHVAYYGQGMLFCGDTLFTGGCGRLFEGTAEQMHTSLMKLAALPDDTNIYCGHEYTAANLRFAIAVEPHNSDLLKRITNVNELRLKNLPTVPAILREEKQTNPFLRCEVHSVITAAENYADKKLKTSTEVFACLRHWKDIFVN